METKTPLVTYESVAQACEAITKAGGQASVRAIINHLGGGSPNTILDFQRQWKAGRPAAKAESINVDPRIGQIIAEQITEAVREARADIEVQMAELESDATALAKSGRELEAMVEALTAERDEALDQVQSLTGKVDQLRGDAATLREETGTRIASVEARAADTIAKAEQRTSEASTARESAQVALAKAELRLEALPRLEAEIDRLRADLEAVRITATAAERAQAIAETKAAGLEARMADQAAASKQHAETLAHELMDAKAALKVSEVSRSAATEEMVGIKTALNAAEASRTASTKESEALKATVQQLQDKLNSMKPADS